MTLKMTLSIRFYFIFFSQIDIRTVLDKDNVSKMSP